VLAKHAAVEHIAKDIFTADTAHAQFDQAVAKKDVGAGSEFWFWLPAGA